MLYTYIVYQLNWKKNEKENGGMKCELEGAQISPSPTLLYSRQRRKDCLPFWEDKSLLAFALLLQDRGAFTCWHSGWSPWRIPDSLGRRGVGKDPHCSEGQQAVPVGAAAAPACQLQAYLTHPEPHPRQCHQHHQDSDTSGVRGEERKKTISFSRKKDWTK